jgi:hypothetical protein
MIQLIENKHPSAHLLDTNARGRKNGPRPAAHDSRAPFRTNNRLKLADVFVRLVP